MDLVTLRTALLITLSILSLMQIPAPQPNVFTTMMLMMDIFNILGSYAVFFVLGATPMTDREKKGMGWKWAMIKKVLVSNSKATKLPSGLVAWISSFPGRG